MSFVLCIVCVLLIKRKGIIFNRDLGNPNEGHVAYYNDDAGRRMQNTVQATDSIQSKEDTETSTGYISVHTSQIDTGSPDYASLRLPRY